MWALKILHEKNLACGSLRSGTSSSTNFSLNSCSLSGISELARLEPADNGLPRSILVSFFVFGSFWLAWSTTGCPVLWSTLGIDTGTGEVSPSFRSSFSRVSLSLDDVVGEEDELEEDVKQCLSCLEGVMKVERWELEDELVDKPGTTIRTKFSVSHCIRIPF